MTKMILSAQHGYMNFGSDIGGYRGGNRTVELFSRWFQLGAFMPLMENGGNDEHRPWMFDKPGETTVVDTYRTFATIHTNLIPYLLTTGTIAYESGNSSISPIDAGTSYDYMLGTDIFVSPLIEKDDSNPTVNFPDGNSWVSWVNHSQVFDGGSSVKFPCPLTTFPAFYRSGAIIPMHVTTGYAGHGDASSADALTLLLNRPTPSSEPIRSEVRQFMGPGLVTEYTYDRVEGLFSLKITATDSPILLLLEHVRLSPDAMVLEKRETGFISATAASRKHHVTAKSPGFYYNPNTFELWIRPRFSLGVHLTIDGLAVL